VADLTNLETKLGEVMGLAMAAQAATEKVVRLAEDEASDLVPSLQRMHEEAAETEQRCMRLIETLEGKKTAIQEEASSTKRKGSEMMRTYLDEDADALDGFEFLSMAECGEVGHWMVMKTMNGRQGDREIAELCEWAIPIQERHFNEVNQACHKLAAAEDPAAVAG
jgi:hypothetical protein